jgi:4-hydroxymandelate oxidase
MDFVSLFDYEKSAAEVLSRMAFDYFASGAFDEVTLAENRRAYQRIWLKYHVMVDVSRRDLSTTVLGQKLSMPILVAPMAFQRLAHDSGEIATVKAAGAAGTVMILSTLSTCSVEEVAAAASGPVWFQLYVFKDRAVTKALVERVEAAGCQALVLTVDTPMLSCRERDVRNQFHLPQGLSAKNLALSGLQNLPEETDESALYKYFAQLTDSSLSWKDVAWLKSITKLPVLVKGVVRADDAVKAVECGVSGIIVSNHGGRQLDSAPATIDVLKEVVDAVEKRVEVLVDGGIRRGTDIVKAIALGARAVLLGRPVLWGLAVGGEQSARDVLEILRRELDLAMALCGCPTLGDIKLDLILTKS